MGGTSDPYPWPEQRGGYRNGVWIDHMVLICERCLLPLVPVICFSQWMEMCPECRTAYLCCCDLCEAFEALSHGW